MRHPTLYSIHFFGVGPDYARRTWERHSLTHATFQQREMVPETRIRGLIKNSAGTNAEDFYGQFWTHIPLFSEDFPVTSGNVDCGGTLGRSLRGVPLKLQPTKIKFFCSATTYPRVSGIGHIICWWSCRPPTTPEGGISWGIRFSRTHRRIFRGPRKWWRPFPIR
jgi:hypothetical protein